MKTLKDKIYDLDFIIKKMGSLSYDIIAGLSNNNPNVYDIDALDEIFCSHYYEARKIISSIKKEDLES